MKGLLYKNMFVASKTVSLLLFIIVVALTGLSVSFLKILVIPLMIIIFCGVGMLIVINEQKESWRKYEQILPISKGKIIACKYITIHSYTLIASVLSLVIGYFVNNNNLPNQELFMAMFLGLGYSCLCVSLVLPILHMINPEKGELGCVLGLMASGAIIRGVLALTDYFNINLIQYMKGDGITIWSYILPILLMVIVTYISYLICVKVAKKIEY